MRYREKKIMNFIPKDVESVLDVGSAGNIFNKNYKTTTLDAVFDADIKQDLNLNQKLPFKDNSFDLVVMNQILEHLVYPQELIDEAKRVSKKYILIGLPNEYLIKFRLYHFLGFPMKDTFIGTGYNPFGHKPSFTIPTIKKFIDLFFSDTKLVNSFYIPFLSDRLGIFSEYLTKLRPNLFANEVYYLLGVVE